MTHPTIAEPSNLQPVSVLSVDVPPNEWMTSNGSRLHWRRVSERKNRLKARAIMLARAQRVHHYRCRVRVDVDVVTRTRTRLDPANAYPTIKPLIDGLTIAGVWVDDDDDHLAGPYMHRGQPDSSIPTGWHRLIFTITPSDSSEALA